MGNDSPGGSNFLKESPARLRAIGGMKMFKSKLSEPKQWDRAPSVPKPSGQAVELIAFVAGRGWRKAVKLDPEDHSKQIDIL
jgi:hypothetical protein